MTTRPDLPPVWVAPMAGGPTTPDLVVAAGAAGGLGLLAAGYLTPEALEAQLEEVERRSSAPYGVNLFLPSPRRGEPEALAAYGERLRPLADGLGVALGEPRWDDDGLEAKLDVVCGRRPAVVSFTFAAPAAATVERVRAATGALVVATVTTPDEADRAVAAGADALALQGEEAGGHRGVFDDDPTRPAGGEALGVDVLLRAVRTAHPDVPLVAAGGLMSGADVRRVLDAGAIAAQLGTAFLRCDEAGTNAAHRRALAERTFPATTITRAFTGRPARALANALARDPHHAPAAYPEVHHLTRPLRAAAARAEALDTAHFWAGTGWRQARAEPVAATLARLHAGAGLA